MASPSRDRLHLTPGAGPGELSPSFAQTGAELSLDDSDIDDLDLHAEVRAGGPSDAYEMREMDALGDHSASRGRWDAVGEPGFSRSGSSSSAASFQLYTPDEEDAVRSKFDRKLVVFVALLYMLSFLDRSSSSPPTKHHHYPFCNPKALVPSTMMEADLEDPLKQTLATPV